jgi:hypothetical protein
MSRIPDYPIVVLAVSLALQWLALLLGDLHKRRRPDAGEAQRPEFGTVLSAELTLLGLIISFTFAMAVSHYDLRKNYEAQEANAIGTEFLRTDVLPAPARTQARDLLVRYVGQRILWYRTQDEAAQRRIADTTGQLERALWSWVAAPAQDQPTPVLALVLSGMNDVLDTQGFAQAAAWNRIPEMAWIMLVLVAFACHLLLGRRGAGPALLVLPVIISLSLFLIADIDSPRGGFVQVLPRNLISLSQSLPAHQADIRASQ